MRRFMIIKLFLSEFKNLIGEKVGFAKYFNTIAMVKEKTVRISNLGAELEN